MRSISPSQPLRERPSGRYPSAWRSLRCRRPTEMAGSRPPSGHSRLVPSGPYKRRPLRVPLLDALPPACRLSRPIPRLLRHSVENTARQGWGAYHRRNRRLVPWHHLPTFIHSRELCHVSSGKTTALQPQLVNANSTTMTRGAMTETWIVPSLAQDGVRRGAPAIAQSGNAGATPHHRSLGTDGFHPGG